MPGGEGNLRVTFISKDAKRDRPDLTPEQADAYAIGINAAFNADTGQSVRVVPEATVLLGGRVIFQAEVSKPRSGLLARLRDIFERITSVTRIEI